MIGKSLPKAVGWPRLAARENMLLASPVWREWPFPAPVWGCIHAMAHQRGGGAAYSAAGQRYAAANGHGLLTGWYAANASVKSAGANQ